jgi:hypothetical protein
MRILSRNIHAAESVNGSTALGEINNEHARKEVNIYSVNVRRDYGENRSAHFKGLDKKHLKVCTSCICRSVAKQTENVTVIHALADLPQGWGPWYPRGQTVGRPQRLPLTSPAGCISLARCQDVEEVT